MKAKLHRFTALLLALLMILSSTPLSALADITTISGNKTESSGTFSFRTVAKYEHTLHAIFKNGNDTIAQQYIRNGETMMTPASPVKEGHRFTGWFYGEEAAPVGQQIDGIKEDTEKTYTASFQEVYYVFFKDQNGRVIETREGIKDAVIQADATFAVGAEQSITGWYTDEKHTQKVTSVTLGTSNIILYAKVETGHWIEFDSAGGSYQKPVFVAPDKAPVKPADPTRPGYRFLHWTKDGVQFNWTQPLNENVTLTAQWEAVEVNYTVIYWVENANDTNYSYMSSETLRGVTGMETKAGALTKWDVEKAGGDAVGQQAGFTMQAIAQETIAGDGSTIVNVYYERNEYSVNFYSYSSSYWSRPEEYTDLRITAKYGKNIKENWPTYNGCSSWSVRDANGPYQNNIDTMPLNGTSFYGPREGKYTRTVYYYAEVLPGEKGETEYQGKDYNEHHRDVTKGDRNSTVTDEDKYPIMGFTYVGGTKNGEKYDGAKFYYTRKTYQIKFINNGAEINSIDKKYEQSLDDVDYTLKGQNPPAGKEGYVFDDWYDAPEGGNKFVFDGKTMPAQNVTVYAHWVAPTVEGLYHLTMEGTDKASTIDVAYGGTIDKSKLEVPAPPKEGYTFLGWSTTPASEGYTPFNFNTIIYEDITLYPYFTSSTKYTIEYDLAGGAGANVEDSKKYAINAYADVQDGSMLKKDTMVFVCWKDKAGEKYFVNDKVHVVEGLLNADNTLTLTAVYENVNTPFTLTYDPNGGTMGEGVSAKYTLYKNQKHTVVSKPSRTGYTFAGWKNGETTYQFADKICIDANETLVAQWTIEQYPYTVEYYRDETVLIESKNFDKVDFGTVIASVPMDNCPTGYVFDKTEHLPLTIGADEKTNVIEVYYKKNVFNVSYEYTGDVPNGVTAPGDETKTYNDEVTAPIPEAVTGYTFEGWTSDDVTIIDNKFTMPEKNVHLKGNWKLNEHKVSYEYDGNVPADAPALPGESTVKYNDTVTVAQQPTLDGYTFKGWTTGDVTVDDDGKFTMPDNDVTFTGTWTKRSDLSYTVHYYWNGTTQSVADDKVVEEQTFGASITYGEGKDVKPASITGYTLVRDPVQGGTLTITTDPNKNEIIFYYYKNVTLTANSDSVTYDGKPHSVSGFTGAPEDANFSDISVGAKGTNAGIYDANFAEGTIGTVDTTKKYIVAAAVNGKLTINKADLTVEVFGNTYTSKYNGSEQKVEGFTTSKLPEGVTVTLAADKKALAAGTNADTYYMHLNEEHFVATSKNYNVNFSVIRDGSLTIEKRNVTLTSASDSKVYDGTALTNSTVTVSGDKFVDGEGASYNVTGTITDVGEVDNTFSYTLNENTNADNYNITKNEGKLKVTPVTDEIVVAINGNTKTEVYDAAEKTVVGFEVVSITQNGSLYKTEYVSLKDSVKAEAAGTDAGTYKMGLTNDSFKNTNANFTNVVFSVTDGLLTINKRPVKITANDNSVTYDGQAHGKNPDAPYTVEQATADNNRGLVNATVGTKMQTHAVDSNSVEITFTRVNAGTYTGKLEIKKEEPSNIRIMNGTNDVTANYEIELAAGTLTISQRPVKVKAESLNRGYKQGAYWPEQEFNRYKVEAAATADDGLLDSDNLTATVTYDGADQQTLIGSYAAVVAAVTITNKNGEKVTENYKIEKEDGTLVIGGDDHPIKPTKETTNKPAEGGSFKVGDEIRYKITVRNASNQTVTNITVTDNDGVIQEGTGYTVVNAHEALIEEIEADGEVIVHATHIVTAAEVEAAYANSGSGTFRNIAKISYTDKEQTVEENVPGDDDKLNDTYEYVVHYYWNNTEIEPTSAKSFTAKVGSTVEESPVDIPGYTPVSTEKKSCVVKAFKAGKENQNPNVINFYYYKNVELTANSDTFVYDGTEKSVSRFTVAGENTDATGAKILADFPDITVGAAGIKAATYPADFAEGTVNTVDNTGKYIVTNVQNGTLTINKRPVTININSAEHEFNGSEWTVKKDDKEYTVAAAAENSGLVSGHDVSLNVVYVDNKGDKTESRTYVGEYVADSERDAENNPKVTIKERGENGADVTDNYAITVNPGKLTIKNRGDTYKITVKANSGSKVYDGKELKVEGFETLTFTIEGNTYTVSGLEAEKTGTNVSDSGEVVITGTAVVRDKDKNDVTAQFDVKMVSGWLTISKRPITLTGDGWNEKQPYTGTAYTTEKFDTEKANGNRGLVEGHTVDTKYLLSGKDVGTYTGKFTEVAIKAGDVDVTSNYAITPVPGSLEIVESKISDYVQLIPNDVVKTYDGNTYTAGTATATENNKAGNNLKIEYSLDGQAWTTDPSTITAKNVADSVTIKVRVSSEKNYSGYLQGEQKMTITPRSVTLTSGSAERVYNGQPLTNSTVTVSGDGFVEGEGASYDVTGSQTLVGESENTFDYTLNDGTLAGNYTIEQKYGTLTVTGHKIKPEKTTKEVTSNYKLRDEIEFTITVKNVSTETVKNIIVRDANAVLKTGDGYGYELKTDDQGAYAWIESLASGAEVKVNATHIVTSDDILAGMVGNTATVSWPDGNETVTSDAKTDTKKIDPPKVDLVVTKTSDKQGQQVKLGDTITYTITVTNTGNVPYTNVVVNDELTRLENFPIAKLAVGETVTFSVDSVPANYTKEAWQALLTHTVTEADIRNGKITNTVTATVPEIEYTKYDDQGNESKEKTKSVTGTASVTDNTVSASKKLTIVKQSSTHEDKEKRYALGETIEYTITVTNDGNQTITNIRVADSLANAAIIDGDGYKVVNNIAVIDSLKPGESVVIKATYKVTEQDILAGKVINNVTIAANEDPETPTTPAEDPTDTPKAELKIEKSVLNAYKDDTPFKLGEKITYTLTVKVGADNNVTVKNIRVTDTLLTAENVNAKIVEIAGGYTLNATGEIELPDMAPGAADVVITYTYTVQESDLGTVKDGKATLGTVRNAATVVGATGDKDVNPGSEDGNDVSTVAKLTITANDNSHVYDGKPHGARLNDNGEIEQNVSYTLDAELLDGHEISVGIPFTANLVGVYDSEETGWLMPENAKIITAGDEDVTSKYYEITYRPGTLTITGNHTEGEKDINDTVQKTEYLLGQKIPFTITVRSVSKDELTGVTVNDPTATILPDRNTANPAYTVSEDEHTATITSLAPEAEVIVYAEHEVTEDDIIKGYTNEATINWGDDVVKVSKTPSIEEKNPEAELVKEIVLQEGQDENHKFKLGETVYFKITVTNTGNVTLKDYEVKEVLPGAAFIEGMGTGYTIKPDTNKTVAIITALTPKAINEQNASIILYAQYTIREEDLGNKELKNIVTADNSKPGEVPIPVDEAKSVSGQKIWKDEGNAFNTRPASITLTLMRKLGQDGAAEQYRTMQLGSNGSWRYSFDHLPKHDAQENEYFYWVLEEPVTGYDTAYETKDESRCDIVNTLQSYQLTIRYWIHTLGETKMDVAFPDYTATLYYNQTYDVVSPEREGTALDDISQARITGTMPLHDVVIDVYYHRIAYRLTIHYIYQDGTTAHEDYTWTYWFNDDYEVPSPIIPGFTPSIAVVAGKMPSRGLEITVVYVGNGEIVIPDEDTTLGFKTYLNAGECFE